MYCRMLLGTLQARVLGGVSSGNYASVELDKKGVETKRIPISIAWWTAGD